jgi:hypothetical protein
MTRQEIFKALEQGSEVFWECQNYKVIKRMDDLFVKAHNGSMTYLEEGQESKCSVVQEQESKSILKTTYAGVTTELSDKLFEKPKVYKNKPRKSYKFGTMSLYYDGVYYFPSDIKEAERPENKENKPFEIQGVYYSGKWYQDTFFITNEFKEFILNAL